MTRLKNLRDRVCLDLAKGMNNNSEVLRIVIVGGVASSLWRFRGDLISELCALGHEVICFAGEEDSPSQEKIEALGAKLEFYPLNRKGTNPVHDVRTFFHLTRRFLTIKPDKLLTYTVKPVVYGSLAGRVARIKNRYALITGLGQQFDHKNPSNTQAKILSKLYKLALKGCQSTIFQNNDDRLLFTKLKIVNEQQTALVNGSGVSLAEYPATPLPHGPVTFLMVARLLIKKGVREYMQACEQIIKSNQDVKCVLIGMEDKSPAGLTQHEIQALRESKSVEYLGPSDRVGEWLKRSHVFVLPSFYGEGIPRTILEALSTGRAVITTDHVGCRDAVEHGVSGLLVTPQDAKSLASAMQRFIDDREFLNSCAIEARCRAENYYDVKLVNNAMIRILGLKGN